jgi:hypothetical protein
MGDDDLKKIYGKLTQEEKTTVKLHALMSGISMNSAMRKLVDEYPAYCNRLLRRANDI